MTWYSLTDPFLSFANASGAIPSINAQVTLSNCRLTSIRYKKYHDSYHVSINFLYIILGHENIIPHKLIFNS